MLWQIRAFPRCSHHVFLSHSAEDRISLVEPVHQVMEDQGVASWYDQNDYSYGRPSRAVLRDGILKSRHTIFFITAAMLDSPRGWCVMELTLAELLQANLQTRGGQLANPILPLYFVEQGDERLPRSVWQDLRDLGRFDPSSTTGASINWAASEIVEFLRREQQLSKDWSSVLRRDVELKATLKAVQGLSDRAIRFDPNPIP